MEIIVVLALLGIGFFLYNRAQNKNTTLHLDPDPTPTPTNPVPPTDPVSPEQLQAMLKADLIEYARGLGIEVPSSWTKGQIVSVILEALGD